LLIHIVIAKHKACEPTNTHSIIWREQNTNKQLQCMTHFPVDFPPIVIKQKAFQTVIGSKSKLMIARLIKKGKIVVNLFRVIIFIVC
jgi:hypothetical protein